MIIQNRKYKRTIILYLATAVCIGYILLAELLFYYDISTTLAKYKILFYLLMLIIAFFVFIIVKKPKNKGSIIIMVLFVILTIVSTVINNNEGNSMLGMIKKIIGLSSFAAVIYISYKISYYNEVKYLMKPMLVIFFALLAIYYCYMFSSKSVLLRSENCVYYLILFLPFVMQIKNRLIQYPTLILIIFACLISMKRTAFMSIMAFFFVFFIVTMITKKAPVKKVILLTIACLVVFTFFFSYQYIANFMGYDLLSTLKIDVIIADEGSGRLSIYEVVLNDQLNSDLQHWLLGSGFNGVVANQIAWEAEPVSAHNDFLEILYDYGIPGLFVYLLFIFKLTKSGIHFYKDKMDFAPSFIASIALFLIFSMTSHLVIYLNYFFALLSFWGICLGRYERLSINYEGSSN